MKIALFHELHAGGARRAANDFAKYLGAHHKVDLYTTDICIDKNEKNNYHNVYLYSFSTSKWMGKNWRLKLYKDTIELYKLNTLHKQIANDIDKAKYDLVFVHPSQYTQAPFILKYLKTYSFYYAQETLRMIYEEFFHIKSNKKNIKYYYEICNRNIRKHIDNLNISSANTILTNSVFTKQNIKKAYGLDSKVCYMGIDTNLFKKTNTDKIYDVLFIGSKDTIDGYYLLDRARKFLSKKVRIHCHISGENWVTDSEYRKLYSQTKISLCLARQEPFGLIPLESMACGTPVIAVNDGGYRETVKPNKTGILIPYNPKKLAYAINTLINNMTLWENMSRNARKEVDEYWSWERRITELELLFKQILT